MRQEKLNIERFRCAARDIYVMGLVGGSSQRLQVIEEAIRKINEDGATAFRAEYLGVKHYGGFGDQRCDCHYGMGPSHGSIVFEIGRKRSGNGIINDANLGTDHIYLLEAVRDAGGIEVPWEKEWNRPCKSVNLFQAVHLLDTYQEREQTLLDQISQVVVDSHLPASKDLVCAFELNIEALKACARTLMAIGVLPEGYCFCFGGKRDAIKPDHEHTGECQEARAALRDLGVS